MATSTFPTAKKNLLTKFQADPGFTGVKVDYGDPGVARLEREHVFMTGTGPTGQTWAPYGRHQREEEYAIRFYVHVAQPGNSQQAATERAHVLFGVAENIVRALAPTSTQVAPGVWQVDIAPTGVTEFPSTEGYVCLIEAEINVKARI